MTELSPRLGLPFIQPSQSQKHVTHNEAVRLLDRIVQLRIVAFDAVTPPTDPDPGACYALAADPELAWAGQGGQLAIWDDASWQFLSPRDGWRAWDVAGGQLQVYSGGSWSALSTGGGGSPEQVPRLGVATAPDATNRLSVSSHASLFSHTGGGHQMKLNKAAAGETATLLFQSNWTGHAEMGLAGDTAFSVKVSSDGGTWFEAIRADPAAQILRWSADGTPTMVLSGSALTVDVPLSGAAVQSGPTDTTPGRLMLAQHGFGPGNLLGTVSQTSGTVTGAVIERGTTTNGDYVRFADGTQICTRSVTNALSPDQAAGSLFRSGEYAWTYPVAFANPGVYVNCSARTSDLVWGRGRSTGATSGAVELISTTQASGAFTIDLTAVGTWL